MRIDIQANGITLTSGLRQHINRRLLSSFESARRHLKKISVRLLDVNGPRGGQDKCCKVHISIVGGQDLVIENTDMHLHTAIEGAAQRAETNLSRRIDKQRDRHINN